MREKARVATHRMPMVIVRSLRLVQPAQQQRLELLNLLRFFLRRGTSHPHPHQPSLPWHVDIARDLLKLLLKLQKVVVYHPRPVSIVH